jgi:hypothetical protein
LLCAQCRLPLMGGDEAALFICPSCGRVHAVTPDGLSPFDAWTAACTTDLAVTGTMKHLAVWRLLPASDGDDPVWEHIRRAAAPGPAHVYVPAFSMARAVVQRLGVRLTEVQPELDLSAGGPTPGPHPVPAEAGRGAALFPVGEDLAADDGYPAGRSGILTEPADFQDVSPILIGQREAWGLAHFILMAAEAREGGDFHTSDIRLEPGTEELLFLPAVWDPRYIHESNWRLLLREFDGLVA